MAKTIAEVVTGEMSSGTVYLDGFSSGRGWHVGVARDSTEPDYQLDVEPTDAVLNEVQEELEKGGLDVVRDQKSWEALLGEYDGRATLGD
jgi:hypothetical protein